MFCSVVVTIVGPYERKTERRVTPSVWHPDEYVSVTRQAAFDVGPRLGMFT